MKGLGQTLAATLLLAPALGRAQVAPAPGTPPGSEVMYVCPGGQDFTARFSADGELVTLAVPGQPEVELSRQISGSGFAYGDSYYELRGRGREATLAARGGGSLRCHAAGRPGQPIRSFADPGGALTVTLLPDGLFRLRERKAGLQPRADRGIWSEEVDGGLRLVLRGASTRRAYRQTDGGLVAVDAPSAGGPVALLAPLPAPDPIDERFELSGMFRVAPDGGVFNDCLSGRLFRFLPSEPELQLERAWTERTPGRDTALHATLVAHFRPDGRLLVETFRGLKPNETCPAPSTPGAALRGTEWRAVEIDGERLVVEQNRQLPTLTLDDDGHFTGSTGCNRVSGAYALDADGVRFASTATTRMHCGAAAQAIEARFLAALAAVRQAKLAGITLDLSGDARRLRLEARGR
jgi:heat shock protein HslJ/membrane-bound inhibitor of C-type lysozyme